MSSRTFRVSELSDEHPSERLIRRGPDTLSNIELVACLLGGSARARQPLALASTLLEGGLGAFARRDYGAQFYLNDLGLSIASRLAASIELAKRIGTPELPNQPLLGSPERVASYLRARAADWPQERVGTLLLDLRQRLLVDREIIRGSLESAAVVPRDVLRHCLLENASAFIVYHNHPSGDPTPSRDDIEFTRALGQAAKQVGIRFLDHIIVGREGCVSLSARGLIDS